MKSLEKVAKSISKHAEKDDTPFEEKAKAFKLLMDYASVVAKQSDDGRQKPNGKTMGGFRDRLRQVESETHDVGPEAQV